MSGLSALNDASLTAGHNFDAILLNALTARSLNVSVGASVNNFSLSNTTVAGTLTAALGDNANNVTLNNILTSVTPIDLALGRMADLNLALGNNTGTATLNALNVGRNLNIMAGNGNNSMFMINNSAVGQDMNFTLGGGNNFILMDTLKVLDMLFIQAGG